MIPELGYGATVAALVLALWGAIAAAVSARTGRAALLAMKRPTTAVNNFSTVLRLVPG